MNQQFDPQPINGQKIQRVSYDPGVDKTKVTAVGGMYFCDGHQVVAFPINWRLYGSYDADDNWNGYYALIPPWIVLNSLVSSGCHRAAFLLPTSGGTFGIVSLVTPVRLRRGKKRRRDGAAAKRKR